jgi:hypothetical protein
MSTADFFRAIQKNPQYSRLWFVGDSWFRYPPGVSAIAYQLEHRYRNHAIVLNDSKPGAETEQLMSRLKPRIRDRLAAWEFDALLVSLGGNDIVGTELQGLVKRPADKQPNVPGVPDPTQAVPDFVDRYLKVKPFMRALRGLEDFYLDIFDTRDAVAPAVPVVMHCYAKLHVTGKRYKLGPLRKGPWILPALDNTTGVGVPESDRKPLIDWMLTEYRALLVRLSQDAPGTRLVVDTLEALPDEQSWENEIHPTASGFSHLVDNYWAPIVDQIVGYT